MVSQHPRQPIIRNAATEVMHVVHADVGREPGQGRGKIIMRTALQGRFAQIPLRMRFPNRVLKLVLDIEQPHANSGGDGTKHRPWLASLLDRRKRTRLRQQPASLPIPWLPLLIPLPDCVPEP